MSKTRDDRRRTPPWSRLRIKTCIWLPTNLIRVGPVVDAAPGLLEISLTVAGSRAATPVA